MAGPHVFKIGHQRKAQIPGQVLVGGDGIAGFGAGIDPVEHLPLFLGVVARFLVAFSPVWILDRDFAVGVGRFGGADHVFLAHPAHQVQPVLLPASVRNAVLLVVFFLFPHAVGAHAVGKEEIVDDEFVKMPADKSAHLLELFHHGGVIVAKRIEQAGLGTAALRRIHYGGQAPGNLDAVALKHPAAHFHLLMGGHLSPEGLQIHLVQTQVLENKGELFFQLFFRYMGGGVGHKISGQGKVAVIAHLLAPFIDRAAKAGFVFLSVFILRLSSYRTAWFSALWRRREISNE